MLIISVDYHPSFQQIAFMDQETGEYDERRLNHSDGEAERFYRELKQREVSVRVGMEATGHSRWFERLLAELGLEVWIDDAAEISRRRVRKQKTNREDARLLLRLLRENLSSNLGTESGESRSTATALASALVDAIVYLRMRDSLSSQIALVRPQLCNYCNLESASSHRRSSTPARAAALRSRSSRVASGSCSRRARSK
jgi:hypothetical protein